MKTLMATLALGLTALAGAAPAQGALRLASAAPADTVADTAANTVTVQNDRKVPVTVYMEYGAFDRRLGTVPALRAATLPLPKWAVRGRARIQLFVHPEGEADDLATQEFSLEPPGRIGMVVPPRGGMPPSPTGTMTAMIPPEELADATLTVDNPRGKPVTVFAEQGAFDIRIGEVPARDRATLRFPKMVVRPGDSIEIILHPAGGEDLASQTLRVRKGEHLGIKVPLH